MKFHEHWFRKSLEFKKPKLSKRKQPKSLQGQRVFDFLRDKGRGGQATNERAK